MKKESLVHIDYVVNQMIEIMEDCSKGFILIKKEDGQTYALKPTPGRPEFRKQVKDTFMKLINNVIAIEQENAIQKPSAESEVLLRPEVKKVHKRIRG